MKKRLPIYSAICWLLIGCSDTNQSNQNKDGAITVRIASLFNQDHYLGIKLDWIAAELDKRSNGQLQCKVFHGGSAGGEKENLEDLLLGNLEIMAGAGSYFYQYCPEATVLELPLYGWKDLQEARSVIRAHWSEFVSVSESKGFFPVALDLRDYWGVFYKHPIKSLDEIRNAKFRSVNAQFWIELTKLHGAIPNPMPYADAYLAFKTGVSDGVLSSVTNATSANWHEILKCYLDTRLVLSESFTLTSKKWISSLPADLRRLVLEVCEESEDVNLQEVSKQYQLGRRKMAEAGVTFIELEQLELAELKQKAFAFRDTYMKSKGAVVYDFYQKWIKHVEEKTGRPQKM